MTAPTPATVYVVATPPPVAPATPAPVTPTPAPVAPATPAPRTPRAPRAPRTPRPVTPANTTTVVHSNNPLPWILGFIVLLGLCGLLALSAFAFRNAIVAFFTPQVVVPVVAPPLVPPAPPVASGFPQTEQEVFDMIYTSCPTGVDCIDLKVGEIHECAGEPRGTCWATTREKDQNAHIVPFWGTNPFSCQQDGYRGSPALDYGGTGVPSGYTGRLEGMTLRPCR